MWGGRVLTVCEDLSDRPKIGLHHGGFAVGARVWSCLRRSGVVMVLSPPNFSSVQGSRV